MAETTERTEIRSVTGVLSPTSMVYEYGARLDPEIAGQEALIERQYTMAHRMYNELVAESRTIRDQCLDLLEKRDPNITRLRETIDGLYESRREARAKDDRDRFEAITTEIRKLDRERFDLLHKARKECRDALAPLLKAVRTLDGTSQVYQIRSRYVRDGLYWATAGAVLAAFARAWQKQWPRFKSVNFRQASARDAHVLVDQINNRSGGVSQAEVFGGRYRLQIAPSDAGKRRYLPFRFRAGPDGQDIMGMVQWHRELPPGASITEARLVVRRVARNRCYYLQLQLRIPPASQPPKPSDRCVAGLALGWYREGDTRRIGAIATSTRHLEAKELRVPQDILGDLDRVEQWQSARDQRRDEILAWLRSVGVQGLPDELEVRLRDILRLPAQHVAPARLAALTLFWRDAFSGVGVEVLGQLEEWRKMDVLDWERISHVRRRTLNRRQKFYQGLAATWAQRHHTIVMHDLDLKAMALIKDEDTGEHTDLPASARYGRYAVALYELERAVEQAAAKTGCRVVRVSANTASICSVCNSDASVLVARVEGRCDHCGEQIERRTNGAANLVAYYEQNKAVIEERAQEAAQEATGVSGLRAEARAKRSAGRKKRQNVSTP